MVLGGANEPGVWCIILLKWAEEPQNPQNHRVDKHLSWIWDKECSICLLEKISETID